jgi:ATP-dependent RNA helicase SUPV3L1/SUV3
LKALGKAAADKAATPGVRAVAAMLADAGGVMPRKLLTAAIGALDKVDRHALQRLKVRLGALDVFVPALLKPGAQHLRGALMSVRSGQAMPLLPAAGAATVQGSADPRGAMLAYRRFGATWLRIDLADRIATHAHAARAAGKAEPIDPALITSLGLDAEGLRKLMAEIGFVPAGQNWRWRGRRPVRTPVAPPRPGNAFAALAGLKPGGR